ncbi:feruloyl esterase [Penicillium taxi]|uniref:feruloyl esterase n=1 Tax=Penicillium taxi TaxID=168475 RepID=UPI002545B4B1|nr:feruloyl esterase [Penicillium taxi]KAJ5901919.1 feruloyl esterase [Penicillium taxi]
MKSLLAFAVFPLAAVYAACTDLDFDYSDVTEHCGDLFNFTGDAGLEAPTVVTNVTYIPADNETDVPAYCEVYGYIDGYTKFALALPAEGKDWSGNFQSQGCGGSCGILGLYYVYGYGSLGWAYDILKRGWIASSNDMGHENGANDTLSTWSFFRNNRTEEYLFASLSTHQTAVMGKAMAEFYYGKPVKRSYFRGGSTGGRQALVAAARYPHDYDGIIAGYAAINETAIGAIQFVYLAQASTYENGTQILYQEDLRTLNAGAIKACDANDGLVDGMIDLAYECVFDPLDVLCTANQTSGCLSSMDKVNAARAMYGYPSNNVTDKVIPVAYLPGSELEWSMWAADYASPNYGVHFAQNFSINAAYQKDLPWTWTIRDQDWDTMPYETGFMEDIYSADFTALNVFRARGGKLIHYQGWGDGNVAAGWNYNLYKTSADLIGIDNLADFHRFFLYPQMAHIDLSDNSTVAWRVDYYDLIEDWVENGVAPDKLVIERYNLTSEETIDYRPYWPYPYTSNYTGSGLTGNYSDVEDWEPILVSECEN